MSDEVINPDDADKHSAQLQQRRRPTHPPARKSANRAIIQFLTVCTKGRAPLLAQAEVHTLLKTIWSDESTYRVGRYVIMPDHIHLFCSPATQPPVALKRWVAFWKSAIARQFPPSVTKLWQREFWDTQLRSHESYASKWRYVRNNPVRAGLVADPEQWAYQGEIHPLLWHD